MKKKDIGDYIIQKFQTIHSPQLHKVQDFVTFLVQNPSLISEQFLLCMAIDLKFELLSALQFDKIFEYLELSNINEIFFKFSDAVKKSISENKGHLFSNHSSNRDEHPVKYCSIMKRETADYYFPNSNKGISITRKVRPIKNGTSLQDLGYKLSEISKSNNAVWWLADISFVEAAKKIHEECCSELVDIFGLSHLSKENIELVYLEIPSNYITSYQPNVTQASWSYDYCPFLSYINLDAWGRTFSVTGHKNYHEVGKERVIDSITFKNEDDKAMFKIIPLGKLEKDVPVTNQNELITEGIKRYKK